MDTRQAKIYFSAGGQSAQNFAISYLKVGGYAGVLFSLPFLWLATVFPRFAFFFVAFSLICALIGILQIAAAKKRQVSLKGEYVLAQIDAHLQNEISNAQERAMAKMGLSRGDIGQIEPIVVGGFLFSGLPFGFIPKRDMSNGKWRSPLAEVSVLFFCDDVIRTYRRRISFIEPFYGSELTEEYYYQDIVAITTKSDVTNSRIQLGGIVPNANFEVLTMATAGGPAIEYAVHNIDQLSRTIANARHLIRDKREKL